MKERIVLAGGSGFLGQELARELLAREFEVVVLGRGESHRRNGVQHLQWDGRTPGDWVETIEGSRGVVNLTGKNVNCRYTAANKREIMESRVNSVLVLAEAIEECANPPRSFVQASSLAIYGDRGDQWCEEDTAAGEGFSTEVCRRWEAALDTVAVAGVRKSVLRIGFALGRTGGVSSFLARLVRLGLGGHVGSGRQYISWIHVADLTRMFLWALEREDIQGVFNATSPDPVTNAAFMRELRRALHRPWSPPVPAPLAYLGAWLMGTEASLALTGRRCRPRRFMEQGFTFQFSELKEALADLYP